MPSRENSKDSKNELKLRKLPSSDPEARDEGPRLLPLPKHRTESTPADTNRYMELAETAMRRKPAAPSRDESTDQKSRTK